MKLASTAFDNGRSIPRKYGYKSRNVNPPLSISEVPDDTKSLVLIMDDPDAVKPAGKIWVHWLIWNISPDTTEMPEGHVPSGAMQGKTDFGETKYGGPAPPDGQHTYLFKLYALTKSLNLKEGSSKEELRSAMKGHVIDTAILKGRYAPIAHRKTSN